MKEIITVAGYTGLMVGRAKILNADERKLLLQMIEGEQAIHPNSYVDIAKKRIIDLYVDNIVMQVDKGYKLGDTKEIMDHLCKGVQFYDYSMFAGFGGTLAWGGYYDEDLDIETGFDKEPVQTERADI